MAYRCTSTSKFASVEMGEPEDQGISVDNAGNVTGDVRCTIVCAECSEEFAESTFNIDETVTAHEEEGHSLMCDVTLEASDDYSGDSKTPYRYRKHMYGFDATIVVTCTKEGCDYSEEVSVSDSLQASAYDSLV